MSRRAIVTGGSRGIGRRVAETLAADGVDVVLTYRRERELAEAVIAGIRESGGTASAVRVELESAEDIDALFADHVAGPLDILVANAAASAFRPIADFTLS
ncbi:MAG TPA: SDR family NAD(P)-dependent oxidoreductase, partial [Galbitalea sp.]